MKDAILGMEALGVAWDSLVMDLFDNDYTRRHVSMMPSCLLSRYHQDGTLDLVRLKLGADSISLASLHEARDCGLVKAIKEDGQLRFVDQPREYWHLSGHWAPRGGGSPVPILLCIESASASAPFQPYQARADRLEKRSLILWSTQLLDYKRDPARRSLYVEDPMIHGPVEKQVREEQHLIVSAARSYRD